MHTTKTIARPEEEHADARSCLDAAPGGPQKLQTISVVAADGCPLLLQGIASVLAKESDIRLLAQAEDGDEALRMVIELEPHVAVLSLHIPGKSGLELLEALHACRSKARPVLLAARISEVELIRAMQLGVRGILLQSMPPAQLVRCIRLVHAGEEFVEKATFLRAFGKLLRESAVNKEVASVLTAREHAVMGLAVSGLSNKEVARRLSISEGTVKVHLHRAYAKLGVPGRLGLYRYAQERGMI